MMLQAWKQACVELLNEISKISGIRFEYVEADTWEDTKNMLINGKADVRMPSSLPAIASTTLSYGTQPIMENSRVLMTLDSRTDLYYKDYDHFSSLKIGITYSMLNNTQVKDCFEDLKVSEDQMITYPSYDEVRTALDNGEVDAVISSIMDLKDGLKTLARFDSVFSYISMSIDNPYLDILDNALEELKVSDPAFIPLLYNKYYSERNVEPLTRKEAEYVMRAETITIGQLPSCIPYSGIDDSGELAGISEDFSTWIADYAGLNIEMVALEDSERPVEALKSGKVMMTAGMLRTSRFQSDSSVLLSNSFDTSSISIVMRRGETYDPDAEQVVAVNNSFQDILDYLAAYCPQYTVVSYDNDDECLDALLKGKADLVLQNVYTMNYLLRKPKYETLEILQTEFMDEENCFAVLNTDDNAILISILNKAIKAIPQDISDSIILANTTGCPYNYTLSDLLYKFRMPFSIIAVLVILLAAVLAVNANIKQKNMKDIQAKNKQLQEAWKKAEAVSGAKSQFLTRMSHEIRTPMNAIIGITDLAKDHTDDSMRIKEDLDRVSLSSNVLLGLINDVLDMSSIESGKMKIASMPFSFGDMIESLTAVYTAQCSTKGLKFECRIINPVDELLEGDSLRINQVLLNLLSNAVKFTEHGRVVLRISQETVDQERMTLVMKVSDTGAGMSDEMKQRLFRPFEQESAATAQQHGGSGLGLSITRGLVQAMNGTIECSSAKGEGTLFTVEIPFIRIAQKKEEIVFNQRLLYISSNSEEIEYFRQLAEKMKIPFETALCKEAGIQAKEALKNGAGFGYVIIDCDTDCGSSTCRIIDEIRKEVPDHVPITAIACYDESKMHDIITGRGPDRYVHKPLLPQVIRDLYQGVDCGKMRQAQTNQYDFTGRKVLLAEDNEINMIVAEGMLNKVHLSCDRAFNGMEALEAFQKSGVGEYDAILMDIQMPVMNGNEAARLIRECDRSDAKEIPIIA